MDHLHPAYAPSKLGVLWNIFTPAIVPRPKTASTCANDGQKASKPAARTAEDGLVSETIGKPSSCEHKMAAAGNAISRDKNGPFALDDVSLALS